MSDADRPDPLAEPEHWQASRQAAKAPPGPDLSVCAHIYDAHTDAQHHCQVPPVIIAWIGCTRGEHAGAMAYCAAHFLDVARLRSLLCAQCGGAVKIMKVTSMDGHSTVAYPEDPGPPPDLWRRAVPDSPQA
jgi:hypothetical protein